MALSVNPAIGQAQAAAVNPFQQRNDDQVRNATQRDADKTGNDTRPANVSAAKSDESNTRYANRREEDQTAQNNTRPSSYGQTRGSIIDIQV